MQNNNEAVTFEAVAKPEWEPVGDHMTPLKKALEHEKYVTASIDAIYAAAYEVRDFRTMQTLDWFIKEQGERRRTPPTSSPKWSFSAGTVRGSICSTAELKARTYAAPTLVLD